MIQVICMKCCRCNMLTAAACSVQANVSNVKSPVPASANAVSGHNGLDLFWEFHHVRTSKWTGSILFIITAYKHAGQEVISLVCNPLLLVWDVQVQGQGVLWVNGKSVHSKCCTVWNWFDRRTSLLSKHINCYLTKEWRTIVKLIESAETCSLGHNGSWLSTEY